MEHGERQRNEHYGRSSSAILKNGVYHYEKNYHKTLIACYLGFITQPFSLRIIFSLSSHLRYYISLLENCVYLDSILFPPTFLSICSVPDMSIKSVIAGVSLLLRFFPPRGPDWTCLSAQYSAKCLCRNFAQCHDLCRRKRTD